jgi:hypothetical protein
MTKLTFAAALLLLLPSLSHASLVNPASREGLSIVHQAATQISKEFVAQTDLSQGKEASDAPDCETVKSNVLKNLSSLDLSGATDLVAAKKTLESASCDSTDRKKMSDKFFTATLSIRSFEDIN